MTSGVTWADDGPRRSACPASRCLSQEDRSDADRKALPQLGGRPFLTDGGLETTLIFHEGVDVPHFAAFVLLRTDAGASHLRKYFTAYAEIARRFGMGLILESPTWRASRDWSDLFGCTADARVAANRDAIGLLERIRDEYDTARTPVVVSGCIGPRGDGYVPDRSMSADEAENYHREQIRTLAGTTADMICALTLNRSEEAIGITRAAHQAGIPVAISSTVETDGRLPTGQSLGAAIEQVDDATSTYPTYYMINCAHPSHFAQEVRGDERWATRIRGIRANASRMSHAELNEASELDEGDPVELGQQYLHLKTRLRSLSVLGGCCGTDTRHVEQIASACMPPFGHRA